MKTYHLKPIDGKLKIDLPADNYLIEQEALPNGVITVTCTPSAVVKLEVESKLNGVNGELTLMENRKAETGDKIQSLKAERNDLEQILATLG